MRHCFEWEACNIIDIDIDIDIDVDITLGSTPSQRSDELGGVSESTQYDFGCKTRRCLTAFSRQGNRASQTPGAPTFCLLSNHDFSLLYSFFLTTVASGNHHFTHSDTPAHIQRRNDPELPNYSYLASNTRSSRFVKDSWESWQPLQDLPTNFGNVIFFFLFFYRTAAKIVFSLDSFRHCILGHISTRTSLSILLAHLLSFCSGFFSQRYVTIRNTPGKAVKEFLVVQGCCS